MRTIDVFNGDADGICALTQIRSAHPVASTLVTGVKRDIELLETVTAEPGDEITVLDVSMDKNKTALVRALDAGAKVLYVDHHFAGEIPAHPNLTAVINEASDVCTSVLVNTRLEGRFVEWAVVGAFGDNLDRVATSLARPLSLSDDALDALRRLGTYINYNGYGPTEDDLYYRPAELFGITSAFASPFALIEERKDVFERLETGYHDDMRRASSLAPSHATEKVAVFILPDESWARRVSGVYGNDLANGTPARAHAVLSPHPDGGFVVSVRAPLTNKTGADKLCRGFATGGGRAAAAGINNLPVGDVDRFIEAFGAHYA
jgi:hypothetical protein